MIQFNSVEKSFGDQLLFDGVSFSLNSGEKCALLGKNGSGKTTLFRLIIGKEAATEGTISIPKHYRIGYLDQHIKFSEQTVLKEAALGLPLEERDALYKAEAILGGLGFSNEDFQKPPEYFSGGFHLRLHLAKVLLSDPDCLLLDEPTNYLDIVSIRWLQRFLKSWKKELIIISHDREFLDNVTTHTLGIYRNKVRKQKGQTKEFFSQILQEEEVYEKTRIKLSQKKAKHQEFIDRFGAKATKAKQAKSREKAMQRLPDLEKLVTIHDLNFSFNESKFSAKKMLSAKQVSFSYHKDPLIYDMSVEVHKGDRLAIIGKNGRGKSTIMRLFAKELTSFTGDIEMATNVHIGYFGQTNIDRLDPALTIEEEIALSNPQLDSGQVRSICATMMFSQDLAKKSISVLSGGEKSRVLLGKILATPCNLLLLDEPTHHLDIESIEALLQALEDFSGAIVIVTHSEMLLNRILVNKLIVCRKKQQLSFLGNYEDFLNQVGWNDEDMVHKKPKEKTMSRQEIRQKVAELVQERAKVLKPLQQKMVAIENKIETLEKKLHQDNDLLIQASEAEQKDLICQYSKSISKDQQSIEDFFEQLQTLSQELEEKKDFFDTQIDQIKNQE